MTVSDRTRAIHDFLRAAIMAGIALYLMKLIRSGDIAAYIPASSAVYIKLSAIGLNMAAVYRVYAGFLASRGRPTAACDCCREPSPSILANSVVYFLFSLPLIAGFLLPA